MGQHLYKTHFEKAPLVPVNAHIALPTRPGFGIEFDEAKIDRMERIALQLPGRGRPDLPTL